MGTLVGFPITSTLNDYDGGMFWKSQVVCGCCMFSVSILMIYVYQKMRKANSDDLWIPEDAQSIILADVFECCKPTRSHGLAKSWI